MVLVTIGEKGGGGKSTLAYHFLSAYFFKKSYETGRPLGGPIKIYEFDAHNSTSSDFNKDNFIEGISVPSNNDAMVEAIATIEYSDSEGENIIIDVGGSDNTDRFLSLITGSFLSQEIIFIIPEMNKKPRSAENTISKIRKIVPDAKIIVALNRWSMSGNPSDEFKFFYGDNRMGIEASYLASEDDLDVAYIPVCDVALGLSEMGQCSLWKTSENVRLFGNMPIAERKVIWGTPASGKTPAKPCSEEVFIEKTKKVYSSKSAMEAIKGAESLFECLDKYFNDSEEQ